MQKESMDLMNVDYDDVLHLYRGWRKSESALKDKNKELNALKNRVAQLQESHDQFRSKINALESVKELTVSLQNQLMALQQENKQLVSENKELAELSVRAEGLLLEKVKAEEKQAKVLKDVQLEFAVLKGRYEESIKTQHYLEKQAADEQALRVAAESRLNDADEHLATAKAEVQALQNKLDHSILRLSQCDHELSHASEHLTSLSREVASINITKNQLSSAEAEAGVLRGDISRLIRLLEHAPETKDFLSHWKDSGGMDFIGMKRGNNTSDFDADLNLTGNHNDSVLNTVDLTPSEFNHLKRIHGGDPFPMSSNLAEESEYWVPTEAAKLGLQFLASKVPHAAPSVIMEFLRSMNKIWLKRERRKIKRVKTVMGKSIDDLKRQLANAKPYKHVMDERQIRRLKSQVKEVREKVIMTGRARKSLEELPYELQTFDEEDQNDESEILDLPPHERRLCKMVKRASEHQAADVNLVSTEKLLQASLNSLESMGRRMHMTQNGVNGGNANNISASLNMSHYHGDTNNGGVGAAGSSDNDGSYPNESYLRGALWLGRNMTMISEDLADQMDAYRAEYAKNVQEAVHDTDPRRSCNRLALLANSGMTAAHSMMNKSRLQIRKMLQETSAIAPGDTQAFQHMLQSLPIESALLGANEGGSHKRSHSPHRHASPGPAGLSNRQSAILATSPMFRSLQSQSR